MKQKIAYAVFTTTDSGKEYMVKGNFGSDKKKAELWAENNVNAFNPNIPAMVYPNGLFVKQIKY